VVRDPAPSINYQSGGGGSGGGASGEDDDVLNSEDKDWIKGQIKASQDAVIQRMNNLVGDVVNNPKPDNEDNKVFVYSALGMLLERTKD
jgi:hypothetical protein